MKITGIIREREREREREGEIRGRERKTNKQKENKFNSKKQFGNDPFIN